MNGDFEPVDADANFICVRHRANAAEFGFLISNRELASGAVVNPDTPENRNLRAEARRFAYGEAVRLCHVDDKPLSGDGMTQWEGLKGWS